MKKTLHLITIAVLAVCVTVIGGVNFANAEDGKYILKYPDGSTVTVDSKEEAEELVNNPEKWKLLYEAVSDENGQIVLPEWSADADGKIRIVESLIPEGYYAPNGTSTDVDLSEGSIDIVNSEFKVVTTTTTAVPVENKKVSKKSPSTGDMAPFLEFLAMLGASGAGFTYMSRRKRK